ncbi:hypothetical protein NKR23_g9352 [Pleurostoma richardsiae]|uniref:LrgB-like protein n=1 Tax=Pleurostoma richardsiae TaxID=41990 RepID=A0AA38RQL3_9PEZI|nr:hypothetical protein NKR23_g9352 [Pleurostoma richardsiae]
MGVFSITLLLGQVFRGLDSFYKRWLKAPTDLLNRHMSIGFVVPLMMISRGPIASPKDIGLIMCCFMITGVVSSAFTYYLALGAAAAPAEEKECRREAQPKAGWRGRLDSFIRTHPLLLICLLSIPLVGLPITLSAGHDAVFDTCLLFTFWTGALTSQSGLKTTKRLAHYPRLRVILSTSLNAVLWTSLAATAYLWAKTVARGVTISQTLDRFLTNTTLADLIIGTPTITPAIAMPTSAPSYPPPLGAGDVALSVLDAGIVSWGLKLYECRGQLLSRAGLTVFLVTGAAAAASVVCGPLLAAAVGVRPAARDLSFAARSVTLALAGPAMASLGGDAGLNAVMVVVNGVLFQMGMGLRLSDPGRGVKNMGETEEAEEEIGTDGRCVDDSQAEERRGSPQARQHTATGPEPILSGEHAEDARRVEIAECEEGMTVLNQTPGTEGDHGSRTVAAGVAIGVNAAAMGAAHLYEQGSRAAPYSTLAMTLFGVMTVVLTSIQPLVRWLVDTVARA